MPPFHLHNLVPFISQIGFVPNKHDDDITSPLCSDIINPLWGLLEWIQIWGEQPNKKTD